MSEEIQMPSLFPELLSDEELKSTLQKKWPKLKVLNRLSSVELIDYYRRMLLPLPQRKYSSTSRGHLLHTRRLRSGLEKESSTPSSSSNNKQSNKGKFEGNRLKLPPDGKSLDLTLVSLANVKATEKSTAHKLVINKRTSSSSESAERETESKKRPNRTDTSASRESDSSRHNKIKNDDSHSKPKKVKITWP